MYVRETAEPRKMSFFERAVLDVDALVSGNLQLPSNSLIPLGDSIADATRRAKLRVAGYALRTVEAVVGGGVVTWGLSQEAPRVNILGVDIPVVAVLGLLAKPALHMGRMEATNRLGQDSRRRVGDIFHEFGVGMKMVEGALVAGGFTALEITRLEQLPDDLYNMEFGVNNGVLLTDTLSPVASGIGMMAAGNPIGAVVMAAGLMGRPLGNRWFAEAQRTRKRQDMARVSDDGQFQEDIFAQEHLPRTRLVNALQNVPTWLSAGALFLKNADQLPNLMGIAFGLTGLTSVLSNTRMRVESSRTVQQIKKIIATLADPYYLLIPDNFRQFVDEVGRREDVELPTPSFSGLVVRNLNVTLQNGNVLMEGVNFSIERGQVLVITGASGKGKSTLYNPIAGIVRHNPDGRIVLCKDGLQKDLHEFADEDNPVNAIAEHIVVASLRQVPPAAEVVDMFKDYYIYEGYEELCEGLTPHEKVELERGIRTANNLLRSSLETYNLYLHADGRVKARLKKQLTFPLKSMERLHIYYEGRRKWVNELLKASGNGNLSSGNVHAERVMSELSDGEKTNMVLFATLQRVLRSRKVQVVLMDELLRGLDNGESLETALAMIEQIRTAHGGVAIGIISHDKVLELQRHFHAARLDMDRMETLPYIAWRDQETLSPLHIMLNILKIPSRLFENDTDGKLWKYIREMPESLREAGIREAADLVATQLADRAMIEFDHVDDVPVLIRSFCESWQEHLQVNMDEKALRSFREELRLLWKYVTTIDPEAARLNGCNLPDIATNLARQISGTLQDSKIRFVRQIEDPYRGLVWDESSLEMYVRSVFYDDILAESGLDRYNLVSVRVQ